MLTADETIPLNPSLGPEQYLRANTRRPQLGVVVGVYIFTLQAIVWVFLYPVAILLQLCNFLPAGIRRVCYKAGCVYTSLVTGSVIGFFELCTGLKYQCYGDIPVEREETALLICNHPTEYDWLYLWGWIARFGRLHKQKIQMKQELAHVPFLGWSLQGAMHMFLTRKWAEDQLHIHSQIDFWRSHCSSDDGKTTVLIFPEGTNIGKHSVPKGREFCDKTGIDRFDYVLPPRSTGTSELQFLLSGLHKSTVGDFLLLGDSPQLEDSSIDAVYDFTIAYTTTYQNLFMNPVKGFFPASVHVHCRRYCIRELISKLADDATAIGTAALETSGTTTSGITRTQTTNSVRKILRSHFDTAVSQWLVNIFRHKDERLRAFYTSPRIDDLHAPPMLDEILVLPCAAEKDSRRVEPQHRFVNDDFAFEVKCVVVTLILASIFYHALFSGNVPVWVFLTGYTILSFVILNIRKFRIDIAILNACKDTSHNN